MHRSRLFQEVGLIILSLSAIVGCSGGPAASGADVQSFELTQTHPRYDIEAHYASEYAETRDGRVAVRVPEVFELANIAFAITP